jgi:sugar phosphate isomerase/epimerase
LLHENEKGIYGDTPERCLDIYKTLDSPNVKLIFDPANFVQCKVETYPYAFNILKDYVEYFHIKDSIMESGKVVPAGYGDGHIKEILIDAVTNDFEGFLSLEPHLGHFEGFDDLESEYENLKFTEKSDASKFKLAADSLRNILKEISNE